MTGRPGQQVSQHVSEGVLRRFENPAQQAALAGDLFALFLQVDDHVRDRHVEAFAGGLDDPALEPRGGPRGASRMMISSAPNVRS